MLTHSRRCMSCRLLLHSTLRISRPCSSSFSTLSTLPSPPPHIAGLITYYAQEHPQLLDNIFTPRRTPSRAHYKAANITYPDFLSWSPIANTSSLTDALPLLANQGIDLPHVTRNLHIGKIQPPTWLVIFILCHKVFTPQDTLIATRLVRYHYLSSASRLRALILTLSTAHLVKHSFTADLKSMVSTFVNLQPEHANPHFNVMLRIIARSPASKHSTQAAIALLNAMTKRDILVHTSTFRALSSMHCLTASLASVLLLHLQRQAVRPTMQWLRNYSIVFARRGWTDKARQCFQLVLTLYGPEHVQGSEFDDEPAVQSILESQERPQAYIRETHATYDTQSELSGPASLGQLPPPATLSLSTLHSATANRSHHLIASKRDLRLPRRPSKGSSTVVHQLRTMRNAYIGTTRDTSAIYQYIGRLRQRAAERRKGSIKPIAVWRTAMRMLALGNSKLASAESVIKALRQAQNHHPKLRTDSAMYCAVLVGLLRRRQLRMAEQIWEEFYASKPEHNLRSFTVGVEVLTFAGRYLEALALYVLYLARRDSRRTPRVLDTRAVNGFMITLIRKKRPDAVFALWDNMEALFGVQPDTYTLAILLRAARFAKKCESIMHQLKEEIGLNSFLRQRAQIDATREEVAAQISNSNKGDGDTLDIRAVARLKALDAVTTVFTRDLSRDDAGLWNGERAGPAALRIAQQIFINYRPSLRTIRSPCQAVRPTSDFTALHPVRAFLQTFRHHPLGDEGGKGDHHHCSETTEKDLHMAEKSTVDALIAYRKIVPSDVAFRVYIDLLASESQIPQIPLALAWMRHLHIRPSRHTLATALIYWGEVAMDAPLVEYWKGDAHQNEYQRLVAWMRKWVGEERMPGREEMGQNMQRIRAIRDRQWLAGKEYDDREPVAGVQSEADTWGEQSGL